jgi:lipopolysaccharide heptosyltransferase I
MTSGSRRESVLVVRLSALGDVLFTLPAVQALCAARPDLDVDWVVEERAAALLDLWPGLRQRIVWRRRQAHRPVELARHVAALRRERYDAVLDFQGNWKSGVHALLARGARTIGFDRDHSREGGWLLPREKVTPPPDALHRVDQAFALVRALAPEVGPGAAAPSLVVPPQHARFAEESLRALGVGERPFVVLNPGTSLFGAIKRWPPDRFGQLGDVLQRKLGLDVVVTWGPDEEALAQSVKASMREPRGHLSPRTRSLLDLAALLARARLVVASDSAPLHLAAFLGTPVVGLYGPKDPRRYGPRFAPSRVVHTWLPCSPCTRRRCPDVLCMEEISIRQVFEAASDLLAETGAARDTARN